MSDASARELERAVLAGDPAARQRLTQERVRGRSGLLLFWRGRDFAPVPEAIRVALEVTVPTTSNKHDQPRTMLDPGWAVALVGVEDVFLLTDARRGRDAILVNLATGDQVHVWGRHREDTTVAVYRETVDALGRPRRRDSEGVGIWRDMPLYDTMWVGSFEARAFAVPVGQSDPNTPQGREFRAKTRAETNVYSTGGRLPQPEEHEVTGVSVHVVEGTPEAARAFRSRPVSLEMSGGVSRVFEWLADHLMASDAHELVLPGEPGVAVASPFPVKPLVPSQRIARGEGFAVTIGTGREGRPIPGPLRVRVTLHGPRLVGHKAW